MGSNPKTVKVIIRNTHYQTEIWEGNHLLLVDEPESLGGKDTGPTPTSLLIGSLAACTAITLRMYADRKQWLLEGVEIEVSMVSETAESSRKTTIEEKITLLGALDQEQRNRLLQIAKSCPLHKTLSNPIQINAQLA